MLLCTHRLFALVALLLPGGVGEVGNGHDRQATPPPSLRGFRVGQTWQAVGAPSMPCETGVRWLPVPQAIGLQAVGSFWRVCDPRDGHTQLILLGDTVVKVGAIEEAMSGNEIQPAYRHRDVKGIWDGIWKSRTGQVLGTPDSITTHDDYSVMPGRHFLEAFFTPPRAHWCALVTVMSEGAGTNRFVEVTIAEALIRQRPCWL